MNLNELEKLARAATDALEALPRPTPNKMTDEQRASLVPVFRLAVEAPTIVEMVLRLRAAEKVADASAALCELWTQPLDDMDQRIVTAREALRDADVSW